VDHFDPVGPSTGIYGFPQRHGLAEIAIEKHRLGSLPTMSQHEAGQPATRSQVQESGRAVRGKVGTRR
jgi:hypothetical protein